MRKRLRLALLPAAVGLVAAGVSAIGSSPAGAFGAAHTGVVSAVPASFTPNVKNGQVKEIAQVGSKIVLGGTFTQVAKNGVTVTRNYILAFNATTGAIDTGFVPAVDGEVDALLPAASGTAVYVGGKFTNVNGVVSKRLALLDINTGAAVAGWTTPNLDGVVNDLKLAGGRLYIGGTFAHAGGQNHAGLATLNPTTGAVTTFMNLQVSGHHNFNGSGAQAGVGVTKFDVNPAGTRMVAVGNFKQVSGFDRDQIVMVDLDTPSAQVDPNWNTLGYTPPCFSWAYDSYMRDISYSPDGSYFVVITTGGYFGGTFELCDVAARWESNATGSNVQPTWADYTGTDSLYTVAVTGAAVYIGGHQRWQNNPYGQDSPGSGAIPRPGLAALDPATGVALSWNPGRNPRGAGAWAMLATPAGLWVGSDTDYIGNFQYFRGKIAFFPVAGGYTIPAARTGTLPANVYLAGQLPGANSNVLYRVNTGGGAIQTGDGGPDWAADTDGSPSPYHNAGSNTAGWSPVPNVDSTVPAATARAIFDSERWDPGSHLDGNEMHWGFPVPAGIPVEVRLYFANRYGGTSQVGQRVFDVALDGTPVLTNYDIVADVGDQTGTMKKWNITSDGTVDLDFTHEVENPLINGIEIIRTDIAPPPPGANDNVLYRSYDGTTFGATNTLGPDGTAWSNARGAFVVNGRLYYGWADGTFKQRTFNGTTFGASVDIDPYNDPNWADVDTGSGQTYRGTKPGFYSEIPNVTGMFYADGRIFYTLFGNSTLFSRAFSYDVQFANSGGVISPVEVAADTTINWSDATGMFVTGGKLYFATRSDGNLHRVDFVDGHPVAATATVISGPGIDGNDWRTRGLFLFAS